MSSLSEKNLSKNKRLQNTIPNKAAASSNYKEKGAEDMTKNAELVLKKQTLEAWARILYNEGMIDLARCNRMIERIEKLT